MKTQKNFIILLVTSILLVKLIIPLPSFAADTYSSLPEEHYNSPWWINLGIGTAGSSHNALESMGGLTATTSLNYMISEHQLLTARYMQTNELLGKSGVKDAGLLYGLIAKTDYAYASISAGLGWFQYDRWHSNLLETTWWNGEHSHRIKTYTTVGIPAEAQLFITPLGIFGMGVIIFADLNNRKPILGAALALQFGNLRF